MYMYVCTQYLRDASDMVNRAMTVSTSSDDELLDQLARSIVYWEEAVREESDRNQVGSGGEDGKFVEKSTSSSGSGSSSGGGNRLDPSVADALDRLPVIRGTCRMPTNDVARGTVLSLQPLMVRTPTYVHVSAEEEDEAAPATRHVGSSRVQEIVPGRRKHLLLLQGGRQDDDDVAAAAAAQETKSEHAYDDITEQITGLARSLKERSLAIRDHLQLDEDVVQRADGAISGNLARLVRETGNLDRHLKTVNIHSSLRWTMVAFVFVMMVLCWAMIKVFPKG